MGTNPFEILISVAIFAIPWVFPDLGIKHKSAITIILFLVIAIYWLYRLYLQTRKNVKQLKQDLDKTRTQLADMREKHSALAVQFTSKAKSLRSYQQAVDQLNILLNVAIASDEHDKIRTIYDALQSIMRELINEED